MGTVDVGRGSGDGSFVDNGLDFFHKGVKLVATRQGLADHSLQVRLADADASFVETSHLGSFDRDVFEGNAIDLQMVGHGVAGEDRSSGVPHRLW